MRVADLGGGDSHFLLRYPKRIIMTLKKVNFLGGYIFFTYLSGQNCDY